MDDVCFAEIADRADYSQSVSTGIGRTWFRLDSAYVF